MAGQRWVEEHRRERERDVPQIRLEQPLQQPPLLPLPVSPVVVVAPRIRIQIPDEVQWEAYHDDPSEDEGLEGEGMVLQEGRRMQRRVHPQPNGLLSPITPRSAVRSPSRLRELYSDNPSSPSAGSSPGTPTISISQCPSLTSSANSSRRSSAMPSEAAESPKPPEYEPMYDYLRSRPPIHIFASPNSNAFLSPTSRGQSPTAFTPYTDEERPFVITLSPLSPHGQAQNPGEPAPPSYEELFLQYSCPQRQGELQQMVRRMDNEGEWAEEICKFICGMVILALTIVGAGFAFNWGRGW
ncbi:hypothetical protein B0O99DRAFT_286133 [Bisporella sp. PMI_857]|nr:hypothetical protein B0O99DRAFT_286133 [Bisporella sp. PMI_857]